MTTPDGREGWSDMFLRNGHSVFLVDQPRRGEAGQTLAETTYGGTETADQTWYTQFRIGTYRDGEFTYNENSQFPQGEEALNQFFRQMTPNTGDFDQTLIAQTVAATIDEVYEKTGKDSILVTHSQGGIVYFPVIKSVYTSFNVSGQSAIVPCTQRQPANRLLSRL